MKKLRNHLNLICSILWGIIFLMDIPVTIKDPSILHFAMMTLHFILVCLFFKLAAERELKK